MPINPKSRPRSYAVYYGRGPVEGLESFDWVILEPWGWRVSDLQRLQQHGVKIFAYLSTLEVPPWMTDVKLGDRDWIHVDGHPWIRAVNGNRVARPDSAAWRNYLEQSLAQHYRQGWDGIFLDTLGDVEDEAVQAESAWLAPQAAELVHLAKVFFGDRMVIINNGLWRVVPLAIPYLDAVCWEGTFNAAVFREPWCQAMIDFLGRTAQTKSWTNLLLTQITDLIDQPSRIKEFDALAERFGFLAYAAPGDYHEGIRLRDGRIIPAPRP